jgi:SAM-dependent methyltransferase
VKRKAPERGRGRGFHRFAVFGAAWLPGLNFSLGRMTLLEIFDLALFLAVTTYLLRQLQKPDRFAGRLFASLMNLSHSQLTDWALSHVPCEPRSMILDVGCGGGRMVEKLAIQAPQAHVCGIDYGGGSVATSQARNRSLIEAGRVEIHKASVSALPFASNTFDLATAIETQYYWPKVLEGMLEISRVLRPGGMLMIVAENYRSGAEQSAAQPLVKRLRPSSLGVSEHRQLFERASYTDVTIHEDQENGWICVSGRKPLVPFRSDVA